MDPWTNSESVTGAPCSVKRYSLSQSVANVALCRPSLSPQSQLADFRFRRRDYVTWPRRAGCDVTAALSTSPVRLSADRCRCMNSAEPRQCFRRAATLLVARARIAAASLRISLKMSTARQQLQLLPLPIKVPLPEEISGPPPQRIELYHISIITLPKFRIFDVTCVGNLWILDTRLLISYRLLCYAFVEKSNISRTHRQLNPATRNCISSSGSLYLTIANAETAQMSGLVVGLGLGICPLLLASSYDVPRI